MRAHTYILCMIFIAGRSRIITAEDTALLIEMICMSVELAEVRDNVRSVTVVRYGIVTSSSWSATSPFAYSILPTTKSHHQNLVRMVMLEYVIRVCRCTIYAAIFPMPKFTTRSKSEELCRQRLNISHVNSPTDSRWVAEAHGILTQAEM